MFAAAVVFYVAIAAAQEYTLSTAINSPLLDTFTGISNDYSGPKRKSDSEYYHTCQKTDSLTSVANILTSAAKIMVAVTVIVFLKVVVGKMLLLPLAVMIFMKMGFKLLLMWPVITKMVKRFKMKKEIKSRNIQDCSERLACVMRRSSGIGSSVGVAVTFSLVDDVGENDTIVKTLLGTLAGDEVAQCMSVDCNTGMDFS